MELIKNHSSDAPFMGPKHGSNFGKCYGSLVGNCLKMSHIKLLNSQERKKILQEKANLNKGSPEDYELCKTLAESHKCSRKRLLTREITCKENSLELHKKVTFFFKKKKGKEKKMRKNEEKKKGVTF